MQKRCPTPSTPSQRQPRRGRREETSQSHCVLEGEEGRAGLGKKSDGKS